MATNNMLHKRPRLAAIEYMRGISMLGVIGIHVGSQYIVNATANINLIALLEIVTRFSVPIFFFISAFGLFYNLDMTKPFNYGKFIKKRAKTVFIPYLVWSVSYLLLYAVRYHDFSVFSPLSVVFALFFGTACYQLYFMIILLWFYLLMPLWIYMVKKSSMKSLTLLFFVQIAFDYYSSSVMNPYGIINPLLRALLVYRLNYWVVHYVFIFVLGGYLAVHFSEFAAYMRAYYKFIKVFFTASLMGLLGYYYYCLFGYGYTVMEAINTAHQLCPAGVVFTLGACIFLFSEFYNRHYPKSLQNLFSLLGRHSYFAYLCHPVFIAVFAAIMARMNMVMTAVNTIIFYLLVAGCSVAAGAVCRHIGKNYCPWLNALTIGSYQKRK